MSKRAEGTFVLDTWDAEKPYDEREGTALTRVHVGKTFSGDLSGTSTAELITVSTEAGPAAYVGVERFTGTLNGRTGGFVLQHNAGGENGRPWLTWKIVETSGTGDLKGIKGEGQITIEEGGGHSFSLDYELG
ncbi:DUF3224 domain-containing protein [Actinoallomurus purpureus]|uniref:DUF3224 domain-containing protein n=1 Tax=Actinoallomurus purpureus TaxID=478114 RepID=UPI0020936077|nr:DUF3224 domain-containing protein [Actinoallomurus purpureus]MCO6006217.1 DUF3224 domain-containing protein [Actinoallomurus purpureus]